MTSKRKQQEQFIQNLLKTSRNDPDRPCRFGHKEIASLLRLFTQVSGGNTQRLERVQFRDELCNWFHITDDFLMDRIFRAFDKGSKGYLRAEDFICGMSTLVVGELEDQTQYCFQVYDLNSDGYISRDEMFHLLKNTLVKQSTEEDPDEGVKDLVETALKKLDVDHDGRVSFSDFKEAVKGDTKLILEYLGPCLPSSEAKNAFLKKLRQ
ncbi:calaxin-like [Babylonia areolata]|uniref:calaxin-like n=1 Tax=Babylonia areolata TaxID=304850 RepID=UPI003FD5DFBC